MYLLSYADQNKSQNLKYNNFKFSNNLQGKFGESIETKVQSASSTILYKSKNPVDTKEILVKFKNKLKSESC